MHSTRGPGRVYLATEQGDVVVVRARDTLEVLATNTLTNQSFIASPIAVDDTLYVGEGESG